MDAPPKSAEPDLLAWAREHLPEHFADEPAAFHHELMRDLADGPRMIARVAPRGHAKSTCATLALPLWCICERRRRSVVIITHELSLSSQFVRDIRNELEDNPRIVEAYGELLAPPERADGERTRRCRPRRREGLLITRDGAAVQARSVGASLRGTRIGAHRPDLVLCDDIEKDSLVRSPEMREKLEHWLRCVVLPAMAPDGRIIVIGSLLHYDSLLSNLRNRRRFRGWDHRVYRALEPHVTPDGEVKLRALWPARWPVERLREERERIGTRAFDQEYQARPASAGQRLFKPEWLRPYDPAELVGRNLTPLIAVDPATGKKKDVQAGDYFAMWIGGVDAAAGRIYTHELMVERIGITEQVRRIVAACRRWRPVKVGIETSGNQTGMMEFVRDAANREGLFPQIVEIVNTMQKELRIEASAPYYESGLFRLPPGLDAEAESQFLNFPEASHDDAPDVCAMAIELAKSLLGSSGPEAMIGALRGRGERDAW